MRDRCLSRALAEQRRLRAHERQLAEGFGRAAAAIRSTKCSMATGCWRPTSSGWPMANWQSPEYLGELAPRPPQNARNGRTQTRAPVLHFSFRLYGKAGTTPPVPGASIMSPSPIFRCPCGTAIALAHRQEVQQPRSCTFGQTKTEGLQACGQERQEPFRCRCEGVGTWSQASLASACKRPKTSGRSWWPFAFAGVPSVPTSP